MAEDTKKVTPDKTQQGKQPQDESVDSEWQDIVEGKYKSPTEVAKAYKELESKYGEQSKEVAQAREFMQVVYPILDEIKNDPELFKALEKKLQPKKDEDPKDEKPQDEETKDTLRELTIAQFEKKHGLNKLSPEERNTIRRNIGDAMYELTGQKLKNVDLRNLSKNLENAYIIVKAKSKSSGSESEDRGSMSSVPGSPGKGDKALNKEEADIADKLGLTREQYLEGKKGLTKL
jgi:hypothetical protein